MTSAARFRRPFFHAFIIFQLHRNRVLLCGSLGHFPDIWPNDCNDSAVEAALRADESDPIWVRDCQVL